MPITSSGDSKTRAADIRRRQRLKSDFEILADEVRCCMCACFFFSVFLFFCVCLCFFVCVFVRVFVGVFLRSRVSFLDEFLGMCLCKLVFLFLLCAFLFVYVYVCLYV